jgi:hypothetical protein
MRAQRETSTPSSASRPLATALYGAGLSIANVPP